MVVIEGLTIKENEIINLCLYKARTIAQIAANVGVGYSTASGYVQILRAKGHLKEVSKNLYKAFPAKHLKKLKTRKAKR